MTITPTSPAPTPSERRGVRRSRRAGTLVAAVVLAVTVPMFGGSLATAASTDTATDAPTDDAATAGVQVEIAATDGVSRDGELALTVNLRNDGDTATTESAISFAVSRDILSTRTEIAAWLDGESSPSLTSVGQDVVTPLAAHGESYTSTTVTVGDDLDAGVYAVRATVDAPTGAVTARGVWTVSDDTEQSVAVIVPITAGALSTDLLTADDLATLTAAGGSLREQLDAVTGTPAILAVDPAIPTAIRVLGDEAPESATVWLDDLMALPNSRFALQFGDADLTTQAAAGIDVPLASESYDSIAAESGAPEPTPTATPLPTDALGENPPTPAPAGDPVDNDTEELPSLLGAIGDTPPAPTAVYWPATGTAGADTVAALSGADGKDVILVPSDTVAGTLTGGDSGARAGADGADLLVYDADASAALLAATTTERTIERTAALAEATAYSALAPDDAPLLLTVDRAENRSATSLRAAILAAAHVDGRTPLNLEGLLAAPTTGEVSVAAIDPDTARVGVLQELLERESDIHEFSTILSDPTLLTAPERGEILQLIGLGWTDDGAWSSAVIAHRAEVQETLRGVSLVPSSDVNLLGTSAPLIFSVRNNLPWPVSLVLLTQPNDARLQVQGATEVTAGPQQTTRVDVPIQARVGNGESSLTLQLRSPTGIAIGGPSTVQVAVRAEWEPVALTVVGVGVGALILLGVIRTVRRFRNRAARVAQSGGAESGGAESGGAESEGADG